MEEVSRAKFRLSSGICVKTATNFVLAYFIMKLINRFETKFPLIFCGPVVVSGAANFHKYLQCWGRFCQLHYDKNFTKFSLSFLHELTARCRPMAPTHGGAPLRGKLARIEGSWGGNGLAENLKGTKSLWPQTIITCSYRLFTFFHFAVNRNKSNKGWILKLA